MNIEEKKAVVESLTEKLDDASAFYLTDFTGLDVQTMTDLRTRLREAGVEYVVVKNRLALRALAEMDLPDIAEFFRGPTGLAIGRADPVVPAKVIDEFASEHEERPSVKVGVVDRETMSADEVARLAKLPSRDVLLAELAGSMQAPLTELAFLMQAMLTEFAGLVEALRAEREKA